MQYLTGPIAALMIWTFNTLLIPLGELPTYINPNYLFLALGFIGLFYWLRLQGQYNKKAEREGGIK